MKDKPYTQHEGRVVTTEGKFTNVMAIALDPSKAYKDGVIRCITSREGNVEVSGYIDRSKLYRVSVDQSFERMKVNDRLFMKDEKEIVDKLSSWNGHKLDFMGLEDPDFFLDENYKILHLYFTMPFLVPNDKRKETIIHLGHAFGTDIDSLTMTAPILMADMSDPDHSGAKEVSIAPTNKSGIRLNLIESKIVEDDFAYSTVRIAIAQDMGKPWKFGKTIFHPKEHAIPWIGGHASPGPLFSQSFIDIGPDKLVGIMNGREANKRVGNQIKYGMFSVGLFIYDYENGKIDWVSPEPLIRDTEAVTITFASQFVETKPGEGILYAHVDDSFVRAYTLFADRIKALLPIKK